MIDKLIVRQCQKIAKKKNICKIKVTATNDAYLFKYNSIEKFIREVYI